MKPVTYFAVKTLMVGGEERVPGDLVPEAHDWPALSLYINEGKLSPVLVATLPKATRDALRAWEEGVKAVNDIVAGATDDAVSTDEDEAIEEADSELSEEEQFDKELAEEIASGEKKKEVDA